MCVCEFQNRTTQNSGAQAGASPGGRAYMTTGNSVCERERFVWGAFVGCCFACGCVLELVVCRVRFARVSFLSAVEICW